MNITEIRVEEFSSPAVITVKSGDDLDTAMSLMQEHGIRHLPVVEGEEVVGVISERDLLAHIGKKWDHMVKIADIMNTSILAVHTNDNLGEVAFQLSSQKKGSAIVLDEKDKLCGIFTTTDALNALVEVFIPLANCKSEFRTINKI